VARNRILIADPNPAVRQTLLDLLQEDAETVSTVDNAEAVAGTATALSANIIVLGMNFKGATGFDIARRLRQAGCPAQIIIVSAHESSDLARAAVAVGASAYVFMSRLLDDLPAAVDTVCEGKTFEPAP